MHAQHAVQCRAIFSFYVDNVVLFGGKLCTSYDPPNARCSLNERKGTCTLSISTYYFEVLLRSTTCSACCSSSSSSTSSSSSSSSSSSRSSGSSSNSSSSSSSSCSSSSSLYRYTCTVGRSFLLLYFISTSSRSAVIWTDFLRSASFSIVYEAVWSFHAFIPLGGFLREHSGLAFKHTAVETFERLLWQDHLRIRV